MNDKIAEMEMVIDELQGEIKELEDKLKHANLTIAAAAMEVNRLNSDKEHIKIIVDKMAHDIDNYY